MRTHAIRLLFGLAVAAASLRAQVPDKFENLRYFPKDVPHDSLIQVMRGFSFSLGVRCEYCHAGGSGGEPTRFPSDEKAAKRKARYMLQMTDTINSRLIALLPDRSGAAVRVQCVTCHRGRSTPATLSTRLHATIGRAGIDTAVAEFTLLHDEYATYGWYDLTEWSVNEVARELTEEGNAVAAIALLKANQAYNPKSSSIDLMLADLYRGRGDREEAIARYRAVLAKAPTNETAKRRLREYGVEP